MIIIIKILIINRKSLMNELTAANKSRTVSEMLSV